MPFAHIPTAHPVPSPFFPKEEAGLLFPPARYFRPILGPCSCLPENVAPFELLVPSSEFWILRTWQLGPSLGKAARDGVLYHSDNFQVFLLLWSHYIHGIHSPALLTGSINGTGGHEMWANGRSPAPTGLDLGGKSLPVRDSDRTV